MDKISINPSVFYFIVRHSEKSLSVSITLQNKYVPNFIVARALEEKIATDYPEFLVLQYSFPLELYPLLDTVKNSGQEEFPQVVMLSLNLP